MHFCHPFWVVKNNQHFPGVSLRSTPGYILITLRVVVSMLMKKSSYSRVRMA